MRLDAHQHFWTFEPGQYPWIQTGTPLAKDYLPADLAEELRKCNLDGCVAVQARQSLEETQWLMELADAAPMIRGVVGWVDLRSDHVLEQLKTWRLVNQSTIELIICTLYERNQSIDHQSR